MGAPFQPSSPPPEPPHPVDDVDDDVPFYRRKPVLLSGLAVIVAALGGLGYYFFLRPSILLDPEIITIPLPTPSISAFVPEEPTEFLSTLPTETLTYALTNAEELPAADKASWPARFEEAWTLTYDDGSGDSVTVLAVQHWHEADAVSAFDALWSTQETTAEDEAGLSPSPTPSPSPSASVSANPTPVLVSRDPVMAGDVQVGESFTYNALSDQGALRTVVVWRNSSAVFVMTGSPAVVPNLFLEYGV